MTRGERLRTAWGVVRSLAIYYGRPWRFRTMDRFYARFLKPGDLAFDLGAHVGNRIRAWRALGARVVAVEPQPSLQWVLRRLYGHDPEVTLIAAAVAAEPGVLPLYLNLPNPTISTAAQAFMNQAGRAATFKGQRWERTITVPAMTIDQLIRRHGEPRFLKIDVEGFEAEALAGLSRPIFAVSVEFVPMAQDVVHSALARLSELGPYRYNASYGDTMRWIHAEPLSREDMSAWIRAMGEDGPAGDVYACLEGSRLTAD